MPDLISALHLSAPEATLAVGGLVLLMLGAFMGEKSVRFISALSVGLVIGVIPGLGGIAGLSLLIPFLYGMDEISALAMLIDHDVN